MDNDVTFWQNAIPAMMCRRYWHSWPDFTVILNKDLECAFTTTECAHKVNRNKRRRCVRVFKCWVLPCTGCQTWHDDVKIAFNCTARSRESDVVLRWGDGGVAWERVTENQINSERAARPRLQPSSLVKPPAERKDAMARSVRSLSAVLKPVVSNQLTRVRALRAGYKLFYSHWKWFGVYFLARSAAKRIKRSVSRLTELAR